MIKKYNLRGGYYYYKIIKQINNLINNLTELEGFLWQHTNSAGYLSIKSDYTVYIPYKDVKVELQSNEIIFKFCLDFLLEDFDKA